MIKKKDYVSPDCYVVVIEHLCEDATASLPSNLNNYEVNDRTHEAQNGTSDPVNGNELGDDMGN